MRPTLSLSLLVLLPGFSQAVILPFEVRIKDHTNGLTRRSTDIAVSNQHNAQYISNITLGGVVMPVMLDTGSSDLWVNYVGSPPSTLKDLGVGLTLSYAVGKARGNVHTAPLTIGSYTVQDQAFLLVTNTSSFSTDIHSQGYSGLLGLGPNSASVIVDEVDSDTDAANTLLDRIFAQEKSDKHYMTILLDRFNDPSPQFTGQMTINELAPGFENITKMPQLPVKTLWKILDSDQHWQVLTTKDIGITGPDGARISVKSGVPSAPKGQLVAVIDSGFTFSQVPRTVSDAIYGRVQGAKYDEGSELWTIPCGQYMTMSVNFGGIEYPIHPLDINNDDFSLFDDDGNHICIGAFQPITSAFSLLGTYDMILGMSFLRNTYTLLDFGDWVKSAKDADDPYAQMLSVTDVASAKADFIKQRLNGVDNTADSRWSLLPQTEAKLSPISDEEKKKRYEAMILSRWPYIFVGCLVFVILVIGLIVWKCCCKRKDGTRGCCCSRGKKGAYPEKGMGHSGNEMYQKHEENGSYLTLRDHGSHQDLPMHHQKYSGN